MTVLSLVIENHLDELELLHGPELLPSHRQALRAMVRCRRQGSDLMVLECPDCKTNLKIPHSCGHPLSDRIENQSPIHGGGTRPSATFGSRLRAVRASACAAGASVAPPPARSVAPVCGSPSSPSVVGVCRQAAGPIAHGSWPAPGSDCAASAPRCLPTARAAVG